MISLLNTNSSKLFNLWQRYRGSTSRYKGSNWDNNRFSSGGLFHCTEFAFFYFLFKHLEGHLHARCLFKTVLLYVCDTQTRYVGWIITVKGFYLLTGRWTLGACQLLLFHSGAYHLYCGRADKYCMAVSWLEIIYSHTVWIYISRELAWRLLVKGQRDEAKKITTPWLCEDMENLLEGCYQFYMYWWVHLCIYTHDISAMLWLSMEGNDLGQPILCHLVSISTSCSHFCSCI